MLPVASTANTPPVEGTLDELAEPGTLELERTELLLGTEEEELGRLEELPMLEELPILDTVQPAVRPNGEGWLVHVALEIQLLLFS